MQATRIGIAAAFAAILIALVYAPAASSSSTGPPTLHAAHGTIRFFANHPQIVRAPQTRPIALRAIRRARAFIRANTPPPIVWPAHHSLWLCIHSREAGNWQDADSGGNGHYGGLQMHPGWGHGTSYYASSDSELVQEDAAEAGYRESGYSRSWLMGQWYHPDCLAYS